MRCSGPAPPCWSGCWAPTSRTRTPPSRAPAGRACSARDRGPSSSSRCWAAWCWSGSILLPAVPARPRSARHRAGHRGHSVLAGRAAAAGAGRQRAPFARGRALLEELAGLAVSVKSVERQAELIGADCAGREESDRLQAALRGFPPAAGERSRRCTSRSTAPDSGHARRRAGGVPARPRRRRGRAK